jgi:hypothetical protein
LQENRGNRAQRRNINEKLQGMQEMSSRGEKDSIFVETSGRDKRRRE